MTFIITLLIVTAILLALLARSKMRGDQLASNQTHLNDQSAIHSSTSEAGHSHTYYVTKDPDAYAKIFVPKRR